VGFVISFVTIGIMWANHHAIFRLIHKATHGLVVANLFLLLCVSFLPFPTKVLGEQLRNAGPDQQTAALFYGSSFVVTATCFNVLWQAAVQRNRLIRPGSERAAASVSRRYRFGVPSYLVATVVAFWSAPVSLVIDGALALLYVLPGLGHDSDPEADPSPGG